MADFFDTVDKASKHIDKLGKAADRVGGAVDKVGNGAQKIGRGVGKIESADDKARETNARGERAANEAEIRNIKSQRALNGQLEQGTEPQGAAHRGGTTVINGVRIPNRGNGVSAMESNDALVAAVADAMRTPAGPERDAKIDGIVNFIERDPKMHVQKYNPVTGLRDHSYQMPAGGSAPKQDDDISRPSISRPIKGAGSPELLIEAISKKLQPQLGVPALTRDDLGLPAAPAPGFQKMSLTSDAPAAPAADAPTMTAAEQNTEVAKVINMVTALKLETAAGKMSPEAAQQAMGLLSMRLEDIAKSGNGTIRMPKEFTTTEVDAKGETVKVSFGGDALSPAAAMKQIEARVDARVSGKPQAVDTPAPAKPPVVPAVAPAATPPAAAPAPAAPKAPEFKIEAGNGKPARTFDGVGALNISENQVKGLQESLMANPALKAEAAAMAARGGADGKAGKTTFAAIDKVCKGCTPPLDPHKIDFNKPDSAEMQAFTKAANEMAKTAIAAQAHLQGPAAPAPAHPHLTPQHIEAAVKPQDQPAPSTPQTQTASPALAAFAAAAAGAVHAHVSHSTHAAPAPSLPEAPVSFGAQPLTDPHVLTGSTLLTAAHPQADAVAPMAQVLAAAATLPAPSLDTQIAVASMDSVILAIQLSGVAATRDTGMDTRPQILDTLKLAAGEDGKVTLPKGDILIPNTTVKLSFDGESRTPEEAVKLIGEKVAAGLGRMPEPAVATPAPEAPAVGTAPAVALAPVATAPRGPSVLFAESSLSFSGGAIGGVQTVAQIATDVVMNRNTSQEFDVGQLASPARPVVVTQAEAAGVKR